MLRIFGLLFLALFTRAEFTVIVKEKGKGEFITEGSRVNAHFTGTFLDGTVFETTKGRISPHSFFLNKVTKCWELGFL